MNKEIQQYLENEIDIASENAYPIIKRFSTVIGEKDGFKIIVKNSI